MGIDSPAQNASIFSALRHSQHTCRPMALRPKTLSKTKQSQYLHTGTLSHWRDGV